MTTRAGQPAIRQDIPGVVNFARVGSTVACAGDTAPESVARIKALGFNTMINLRQAHEPGANVDAQAAAAQVAGLPFVHLPFSGASPDPATVERFLAAIAQPGAEPAYICCASGNRAAALWMIKRIALDRWAVDRAADEAAALGLTSPWLRQFAIDYGAGHRG